MKKYIKYGAALLALAALCGCSSLSNEELMPSDISLEELEKRMEEATDPNGRYRDARSFVMKQVVETKRVFDPPQVQMVETKYMRPGFFKVTTYEDNQPRIAVISNGECSWTVDYEAKKVKMLDAEKFRQVKKFSDITSPGSKLSGIFSNITVQMCRIGDKSFYKVACPDGNGPTLNAYVGADSCQIERITIVKDGEIVYDSSLKDYGLYEGVRIPEETVVRSGDSEKVFKVIYCKLNSPIELSEFRPPAF